MKAWPPSKKSRASSSTLLRAGLNTPKRRMAAWSFQSNWPARWRTRSLLSSIEAIPKNLGCNMYPGCAFASKRLTHGERYSPQGRQNANYFDRSTFGCRVWRISNGARNWLLWWRRPGVDFADRYHPVAVASDLSEKTRKKIGRNLRRLPQADAVPAFFAFQKGRFPGVPTITWPLRDA